MKYAVITGSTRGIGKSIAEKLLYEGWFVFVNYAYSDDGAKRFSVDNKRYNARFMIIKCEISSYENVKKFISKILAHTPKIDCLILNAGATNRSPFDSISHEDWQYVIDRNVSAPFYLIHGLRNHFNPDGRIIFIGSILGVFPHSVSLAYGVTKAAVHQMAKELVKYFADKHVTVNAVVTGFTETDWQRSKSSEHRKRIEDKIATGRFALPEEIASLCLEIVKNSYINGANIYIDGGYCYQ